MKANSPLSLAGFRRFLFFLFASGFVLHPSVVRGANQTVTSLADSGPGSLREALDLVGSGQTVNFAVNGIINLNSHLGITQKNIVVSGPGASLLTVRRSPAAGTEDFGIFRISGAALTIEGITISNGRAREGGAAFVYPGTLTVRNCVFSGNSASRMGGALYGYAFWDDRTSIVAENCTFIGNDADDGGAMALFTEGLSDDDNGTVLTVRNCTISQNTARRGGAIYTLAETGSERITTLTITGTTINDNVATSSGGGIMTLGSGYTTITSSTICNNSASLWGGAMVTYQSTILRNCTISGNSATDGGAIASRAGPVNVGGTIFKRGAAGINLYTSDTGSITSAGFNLSDDDGSGRLLAGTDLTDTNPYLDEAGLRDHGGPTKTIALTSLSPAIDHGTDFGQSGDQRGWARRYLNPSVADGAGSDGSDIGAFEATDPDQTGPVIQVNALPDGDDGSAGTANCTLREAVRRCNELPGLNTITFAPFLTGSIVLNPALSELTVNSPVTIAGPGARTLAVSGSDQARIVRFIGGGESSLSGLTLRNGRAPASSDGGGALINDSSLTIEDCAFSANLVTGLAGSQAGAEGMSVRGGAILNRGLLRLNRCSFSGNTLTGGNGAANPAALGRGGQGGAAQGSAVFSDPPATLMTTNCTFAGNTATGGRGGNGTFAGGNGGAARGAVCNGGAVTLVACTVSGNTGTGGAGGTGNNVINNGASGSAIGGLVAGNAGFSVSSTISAGNSGGSEPDVSGTFSSGGHNLIGRTSGGSFSGTGDQAGTNASPLDAKLGLFQNNGGQTNTMRLLTGSPAIDRGHSLTLTTDQRGNARIYDAISFPNAAGGDGADTGAVEETDPLQTGPEFYVTTLEDHNDGVASNGDCSLREAILAANSSPGADTIRFHPSVSGVSLLTGGEFVIQGATSIVGPGARVIALDGSQAGRIFRINNAGLIVSVSGLTVRNGRAAGVSAFGAGISNNGVLTVSDCSFTGHTATGLAGTTPGQAGGAARGAALFNTGTLTVIRCSFSGNTVTGGIGANNTGTLARGGAGGAAQGAIFNDAGGSLSVTNSTLYGNTGTGGRGGNGVNFAGGNGGAGHAGIVSLGAMTLTSCTVSGNTGTGGGGGTGNNFLNNGASGPASGGLVSAAGSAAVANSISAGNTGAATPDVSGTFNSQGWNLIGKSDGGTGFTAPGDQAGTLAAPLDAKLGLFQDNGGSTNSISLLAGSPATDQGRALGLTTDQRGQERTYDVLPLPNHPGGDGTDIGAMETDPPQASPFVVTTLDDHNDGTASFRDCTLREALMAANASAGADVIQFQAGVSGVCYLTGGELLIETPLTLQGPGAAALSLDAGQLSRILRINTPGLEVTVADLTLQRGRVTGHLMDAGGAISNKGLLTLRRCVIRDNEAVHAGPGESKGGGVYNLGILVADQCTFSGNSATGGHDGFTGSPGQGGALYNTIGSAFLTNCTFSGNTAAGGLYAAANSNSGGAGEGGAVYSGGTLTATGCTFSGNSAEGAAGGAHFTGLGTGGAGGAAEGGAIRSSGPLTLTACTLAGNAVAGGAGGAGLPGGISGAARGGGVFLDPAGSAMVRNTILAANSAGAGPDAFGAVVSGGYNLTGNGSGSSGFSAAGDQTGTPAAPIDPLLGPLQNNGGFTATMALLEGSPALDGGHSFSIATDQTGQPRRLDDSERPNAAGGDGTDIGSVEMLPGPVFVSVTRTASALHLILRGQPFRAYQLQVSGVTAGDFVNLGAPQVTDSTGRADFTDNDPSPQRRFYRALLSP